MRAYRLALFVVVCLGGATVAGAQVNRATISGTVTDSLGAAIPGVTVTVTGESGRRMVGGLLREVGCAGARPERPDDPRP